MDFTDYNVTLIAELLKLFLLELAEPLLTFDMYDRWIQAASKSREQVSETF